MSAIDELLDDRRPGTGGDAPPTHRIESAAEAVAVVDGRRVVNLAVADYLGLSTHPRVRQAAVQALQDRGTAVGAPAEGGGGTSQQLELEQRLAAFKGRPASRLFPSARAAGSALLETLGAAADVVVADPQAAGASAGCREVGARLLEIDAADVDGLRDALRRAAATVSGEGRVWLFVAGVSASTGTLADLPAAVDVARDVGALLVVDDGHGTGVLGAGGRGTIDYFGVGEGVDAESGTLGAALAGAGGYVAGSEALIERLRGAAALRVDEALPPPAVAAALAAIDLLERDPSCIESLWRNTERLDRELRARGLTGSGMPVVALRRGRWAEVRELSERLFEAGVYAPAVGLPRAVAEAAPAAEAALRAIVTAAHTAADVDRAVEAIQGILGGNG